MNGVRTVSGRACLIRFESPSESMATAAKPLGKRRLWQRSTTEVLWGPEDQLANHTLLIESGLTKPDRVLRDHLGRFQGA
jgi:hypothetical protein